MLYTDDKQTQIVLYKNDNAFIFKDHGWVQTHSISGNLTTISLMSALKIIQKSHYKIKQPIGIVGTHIADNKQYALARTLGQLLGEIGFTIICGGRSGVMKATCEGVHIAGGISIGLLPTLDVNEANEFVSIPVATGIGFARNSIIAASAYCLVAVGGSYGTISEIAFGLQYNKLVVSIDIDVNIDGLVKVNTVEDIINTIAKNILKLDKI